MKNIEKMMYREFLKRGCVIFKINDVNFITKDYRETFLFFDYIGFTSDFITFGTIGQKDKNYIMYHPFFVKIKNYLTEKDILNILHMFKIYNIAFKLVKLKGKKLYISWDNEWIKHVRSKKYRKLLSQSIK